MEYQAAVRGFLPERPEFAREGDLRYKVEAVCCAAPSLSQNDPKETVKEQC